MSEADPEQLPVPVVDANANTNNTNGNDNNNNNSNPTMSLSTTSITYPLRLLSPVHPALSSHPSFLALNPIASFNLNFIDINKRRGGAKPFRCCFLYQGGSGSNTSTAVEIPFDGKVYAHKAFSNTYANYMRGRYGVTIQNSQVAFIVFGKVKGIEKDMVLMNMNMNGASIVPTKSMMKTIAQQNKETQHPAYALSVGAGYTISFYSVDPNAVITYVNTHTDYASLQVHVQEESGAAHPYPGAAQHNFGPHIYTAVPAPAPSDASSNSPTSFALHPINMMQIKDGDASMAAAALATQAATIVPTRRASRIKKQLEEQAESLSVPHTPHTQTSHKRRHSSNGTTSSSTPASPHSPDSHSSNSQNAADGEADQPPKKRRESGSSSSLPSSISPFSFSHLQLSASTSGDYRTQTAAHAAVINAKAMAQSMNQHHHHQQQQALADARSAFFRAKSGPQYNAFQPMSSGSYGMPPLGIPLLPVGSSSSNIATRARSHSLTPNTPLPIPSLLEVAEDMEEHKNAKSTTTTSPHQPIRTMTSFTPVERSTSQPGTPTNVNKTLVSMQAAITAAQQVAQYHAHTMNPSIPLYNPFTSRTPLSSLASQGTAFSSSSSFRPSTPGGTGTHTASATSTSHFMPTSHASSHHPYSSFPMSSFNLMPHTSPALTSNPSTSSINSFPISPALSSSMSMVPLTRRTSLQEVALAASAVASDPGTPNSTSSIPSTPSSLSHRPSFGRLPSLPKPGLPPSASSISTRRSSITTPNKSESTVLMSLLTLSSAASAAKEEQEHEKATSPQPRPTSATPVKSESTSPAPVKADSSSASSSS